MSRGWHFVSGDYNVVCDRCSRKMKASKLKKEWTGLMVCGECFEHRHPQDFLRTRHEKIAVPWSRPQADTPQQIDSNRQINSNAFNSETLN